VIDLALLEVDDGLLSFPAGLPGFPGARRFRVRPLRGTPFSVLEAYGAAPLALVVVDPTVLDDDVDTGLAIAAHPDRPRSAAVRCIVTPDDRSPTVNLLGPLVVDRATGATYQVELPLPGHASRSPLALRG
jgi:flagellar assembly factor FliW